MSTINPLDPYGGTTPNIERQLGNAYDVVRFVATNMDKVQEVNDNMEEIKEAATVKADVIDLRDEAEAAKDASEAAAEQSAASKNSSAQFAQNSQQSANASSTSAQASETSKTASEQASVNSAMSAGQSNAYSTEAKNARDAALAGAGPLYATEAEGRAATADGLTFRVQGIGDIAATVYRRVNSTTSTLITTYPSGDIARSVNSAGIKTFFRVDTTNLLFTPGAGYTRSVADNVIRLTPDGVTTSIGYFANSTLPVGQQFSPKDQNRVGYRMRHFSGTAAARLYEIQLRDTAGVTYQYRPYASNNFNTGRISGWATYVTDISKKPDGSEWGSEVINGVYIALYAPNLNNAVIDFEWIAVGTERADFATNADLNREVLTLKNTDIPSAITPVVTTQKYNMRTVLVEMTPTVNPTFLGPSGFTFSVVGSAIRYVPSGTGTGPGWASRTLTTPLSPAECNRIRYKIRQVGGNEKRTYMVFLRDSAGNGHYYYADSAGIQLRDSTDYIVYDVDISLRPDGTAWPAGVTITQVWISLSDRVGNTSWDLEWFCMGFADSLYAPVSVVADTQTRLSDLEKAIVPQRAMKELMEAVTDPLHSVEIQLIGDSITWGVGSTGATDDGQGHNVMTNNTWANLLHKWLGESYIDGVATLGSGVATYNERSYTALSNIYALNGGLGFTMKTTALAPLSTYNVNAFAYSNMWEFSSSTGSAKNKGALKFKLTGDNLTFMYCPTNTADEVNSIIELWGNGIKLGEFSYFGAEAWHTEKTLTFPFGRYDMEVIVKSASNIFRLEGFKADRFIRVINDGISGTSTGSWLPGSTNLNNALAKRAEFVFMQLGTNDRVNPSGSYSTYLFSSRIAQALVAAQRKVIVMASNAVSDAIDYGSGRVFTQRRVADALKNMAEDFGLDFINNYQATVPAKMYGEVWAPDGLHPNDYGYKLIFENIRNTLLK